MAHFDIGMDPDQGATVHKPIELVLMCAARRAPPAAPRHRAPPAALRPPRPTYSAPPPPARGAGS